MLPRHGVAYSVMLLAYVAMIAPRRSLDDWIHAATLYGGHLAASTDLSTPARQLVDCGLAREGYCIEIAPQLTVLVEQERGSALREIAQLLLLQSPPIWLRFVVSEVGVAREYIPESDLRALRWLEPDLDEMLMLCYEQLSAAEYSDRAKEIGYAGELFVLAALRYAGARAVHIAQFSDAYGYDIDIIHPHRHRIEVKAAGPKTAGEFYLTRNEFAACERYDEEWQLMQIIFNSSAFLARELNDSHVTGIFTLASSSIRSMVPPDTEHFSWRGLAAIRSSGGSWQPTNIVLDPNFTTRGFNPNY